ncbi:MAG: serine O-acetyltransferase [Dehalococcoidia bacterium]|nr:MAG: serine O-acetyltransferase [Dehalococcoidia bacterium]
MREDIQNVFAKDPAARSWLEVLTCYPGLHALWNHRVAHWMWTHHLKLAGRMVSQCSRFFTNIEIHPGAKIGRRFFIDHGAGVVIGETSEIGDDVLMYAGTELAGTTLNKGKRHPTIGSGVVIGAGAIILGAITIGDGAKVGAGSVVTRPVPAGATVVGVPGHIVEEHRKMVVDLEHGKLPDPVAEAIRLVLNEQTKLEERLKKLEKGSGITVPPDELRQHVRRIVKEFSQGSNGDENDVEWMI